jgi:hypothetical protein
VDVTHSMQTNRYRLLFDWPSYETALRATAARRGWTDDKISAALQRDRLCTVDVRDLEAHLDWHERLGFMPPQFSPSEG